MSDIAARLDLVRGKVAEALKRSGRTDGDVELLAVSKTWPAEVVGEAVAAGHKLFGENKVQEAEAKVPLLPADLAWHLVGPLQRNKVRKALPLFQTLHGVGSLKLAEAIERVAGELGCHPRIFLQINIGSEESKSGFLPDEIERDLEVLLNLERTEVLGLMTIPPREEDPSEIRRWFVQLRELRDKLEQVGGAPLPGLSMGMSHDYEIAIEEGSTIVRVGSAIFGPRTAPQSTRQEEKHDGN